MRECDIDGRLTLSNGTDVIEMSAAGEIISLELPASVGFNLDPIFRTVEFHNRELHIVDEVLSDLGVSLNVQVSGRVVASMGKGSKAGLVSKALKLSPLRLHVIPLLAAFFENRADQISNKSEKK